MAAVVLTLSLKVDDQADKLNTKWPGLQPFKGLVGGAQTAQWRPIAALMTHGLLNLQNLKCVPHRT